MCRNKNGEIINDKHGILNRWVEHFSGILNNNYNPRPHLPITIPSNNKDIEVPTIDEIKKAIIKLKNIIKVQAQTLYLPNCSNKAENT